MTNAKSASITATASGGLMTFPTAGTAQGANASSWPGNSGGIGLAPMPAQLPWIGNDWSITPPGLAIEPVTLRSVAIRSAFAAFVALTGVLTVMAAGLLLRHLFGLIPALVIGGALVVGYIEAYRMSDRLFNARWVYYRNALIVLGTTDATNIGT